MMNSIKKWVFQIINEKTGLLYVLLFTAAIAIATFVENDYGTETAQKLIYTTTWFELLIALIGLSVLYSLVKYQLWKRKQYSVLLFHISIIIIIIGSGITRFWGFEGMMNIREGQTQSQFVSSESYVSLYFTDKSNQNYEMKHPVLFSSLGSNHFKEIYQINNQNIQVTLKEFIPNCKETTIEDQNGKLTVKIVVPGKGGRIEEYLEQGQEKNIGGVNFSFKEEFKPGQIQLSYQNSKLFIRTDENMSALEMATQTQVTFPSDTGMVPLMLRSLYQLGGIQFVVPEFQTGVKTILTSGSPKLKSESVNALRLQVDYKNQSREILVKGSKGIVGEPVNAAFDDLNIQFQYGAILKTLPFSLKLDKFELERYPGTNSPASFSSFVQVSDPVQNESYDYHIFMNHILDHGGYRFFQSSYDQDEKGTYLSVNHDFGGTWVSYLGYFLLTVGMIWTLIDKKTRFALLRKTANKMSVVLAFLLFPSWIFAQNKIEPKIVVPSEFHAEKVSKILVQDVQGRMKPMHTFSREILRKVYGSESFDNANADQVVLGIWGANENWYTIPFIKIGKDDSLKILLNVGNATHLSFRDFFDEEGNYVLGSMMEVTSRKADKDKGTFDKALVALDERVSIMNMLFSGTLFKWVPIENDSNRNWGSAHEHHDHNEIAENTEVAERFFDTYKQALHDGIEHQDYKSANDLIDDLHQYQIMAASEYIPSDNQRSFEILLNESKIFIRLAFVNTFIGFAFLFALFLSIFSKKNYISKLQRILLTTSFLTFVLHTLGLGIRWYVSERAPWSNGYESMIYIAWTAVLAGLIFNRKSLGGLASTFVLSGIMLFIAHLSFLNPEITPLVPVLKSYWLTIHVSMEAGSYGFLLLGGIIGLLNLLLFVTLTFNHNYQRTISHQIEHLTKLSEITITGGLIMLAIGTYLGGVWANESWGRYWGWDAKETWALVSIMVYALILHMRFIPGLRGNYAFNVASIFGFASVIMTYFGVNYYLSGLHSYAAGDPVPVPTWVYISVVMIAFISIWAHFGKRILDRSKNL
jgi:cytochrome c-type biogenesis protein CcsB